MRNYGVPGLALFALTLSIGCEPDPLSTIDPRTPTADEIFDELSGEEVGGDELDDVDDNDGDDNDDGSDVPGDDVVIPTGDNTPDGLTCADGAPGTSWRETLPARPASVTLPSSLASGSDVALAGCDGDPVTETGTEWGAVTSTTTHIAGRYYFEAETRIFESGSSTVGVYAEPAGTFDILFASIFQDNVSAGGIDGPAGLVGIAVDLDAGVGGAYVDGDLRSTFTLLQLPGVGAFHAAVQAQYGANYALNTGAAPFQFTPPAGFAAWDSNADGSGGACVIEEPAPIARAPITIGQTDGYGVTSYTTDAVADTELIVVGAYDTGSVANWTWAVDDAGNVTQEPVEGAHAGSALVTVNRPGPIALVLSVYEPTDWTLVVADGTELVSVSVYGMHGQTITGVPDGVPVDVHSICSDRNGGGNCDGGTGENFPIAPHQWPFDTGGGDTQGFISFIEAELCLPLKHFAGAYLAREITIN